MHIKIKYLFIVVSIFCIAIINACQEESSTESDVNPPQVEILNPSSGAVLTVPVNINISATDKGGISKIVVLLDGDTLGILTSEPFVLHWNVGYWADGQSHTLLAVAEDKAGNEGQSSLVTVTISEDAIISPQLLNPVNGAAFGENDPVSFLWSSLHDAVTYEFTVSDDPNFLSVLINQITTDTSFTDNSLTPDIYFWRVRSANETNQYSAWSEPNQFSKLTDKFQIETVMSVATAADANPEIVRMVPGSDNMAAFIAPSTNQLFTITYDATSFTINAPINLAPGSATAEMTSIDISPVISGENYVAVCVAEIDCARGWILLVKLSDGSVVAQIDSIGYNPDGCAFTKNGSYLIVACEDDRDDRPCKPAGRNGGSFSVIDLTNGVANATLVQDYLVDWDTDSEPEHCETSSGGTVVVSVQETSQIVIFNTADLPLNQDDSDVTIVNLPDDGAGIEAEPDGLYISPDGNHALISNERNGTFQMMSLPSGTMLGSPYIIEQDITAPPYNIDMRKATKRTEPEECSLVEKEGHLYAIFALQECHAVIVYDVTDPANPVFDSIAEAGIDWANDNSMEKSTIGSEGLGAHPTNGIVFSANEREGSITMFRAQWAE